MNTPPSQPMTNIPRSRLGRWFRLSTMLVIAAPVAVAFTSVSSAPAHAASPLFTGAVPQRIVDTRPNSGLSPTGALTDGKVVTVSVGTSKPVVLNLTAAWPNGNGYFSAFPCGQARPSTSVLNFASQTTANMTIATPNQAGQVCIFARVSPGRSVHLVVDKYGVLNGSPFAGQTPTRRLDTRTAGGKVGAGQTRTISGLPAHAAVALNLTVTKPDGTGNFAAYPCTDGFQGTSNLNFNRNEDRAVLAIVRADSKGNVCVRSSVSAHMVVDQMGVFASDPAADIIAPARLVDTRKRLGGTPGQQFSIDVDSVRSASGEVFKGRGRAAVLSIVAVSPRANGYISVGPCSAGRPQSSLLNFPAGRFATSNAVVIQPDQAGKVCVWASTSIDLVLDLNGFLNTAAASSMTQYEPRTDCIRGSLSFVDAERRRLGRASVTWDEQQFKKACAWAHRMAAIDTPNHWTWPGFGWGEIVAYTTGTGASRLEQGWLSSPGHRAIIIDPRYKQAAFAYLPTDQPNIKRYWGVGQFRP